MFNKETKKYHGYIYSVINHVNDKKYIGQTIRSLSIRFAEHIRNSQKSNIKKKQYLQNAIALYGKDNFSIEQIEEHICDTKEELKLILDKREKYYIAFMDTIYPHGYNLTKGGQIGVIANYHSVDMYDIYGNYIRSFISEAEASEYIKTAQTCISKCCLGEAITSKGYVFRFNGEPFEKYKVPDKKYIDTYCHSNKIDQYSIDGVFMRTFENIEDILRELNIKSKSLIFACCRKLNHNHTAYGYRWTWHGDTLIMSMNKSNKMVDMYSLDGDYLRTFNSVSDASEFVSKNRIGVTIGECCNGKIYSAYGYRWTWAGNELLSFTKYKKRVNQYSLNGEYIHTFNTAIEASKFLNLNYKNQTEIFKAVCGKTKNHYAYGYRWYYEYDITQPDETKIVAQLNK